MARRVGGNRLISYLVILVAGIILYVPFGAKTLYHVDSVGFALAIHHFDLRLHQPGGTGYPLYVLALRAIKLVTNAPDVKCILILSIVASVASAMLFYALVASWVSSGSALLCAILLLTSPIVWFNAEIPMSYPVGLLSSVAVAFLSFQVTKGNVLARYLLPPLWGVAAGFRQDAGVMVAPLVVYCARVELLRSRRYATVFIALAVLGLGSWFVPLIVKSGGLRSYLGSVHSAVASVSPLTLALRHNLAGSLQLVLKNAVIATTFLGIGSIGFIVMRLVGNAHLSFQPTHPESPRFLVAWALPGYLIHVLTTVGHSGYVLPYLPAVMLLATLAPNAPALNAPRRTATLRPNALVAAGAVALQVVFFLLVPQQEGTFSSHWVSDTLVRSAITEPARSRIAHYDATLLSLVAEIKSRYPSNSTLLIVPVGDELPNGPPVRPLYSQARYYLPEWEQRVLYAAPLELLREHGMNGPVIAEVTAEKFQIVNTSIVTTPSTVRWLVWFCDVGTQPYAFDDSWTRYRIGPKVDFVMEDLKRARPKALLWGPFTILHEGAR